MKRREFNKILRTVQTAGCLDQSKVALLEDQTKEKMLQLIVKNRQPIFQPFVSPLTDMNWLHSMGYLYLSKGKIGWFLHTCEHQIM